jgi:hypothetical protein
MRVLKIPLLTALFVGSVFSGLSYFLEHADLGAVILFLAPGLIVGIMFSGNVHAFSIRAVAVGNFIFYFSLTYLVLALYEKYNARRNTT